MPFLPRSTDLALAAALAAAWCWRLRGAFLDNRPLEDLGLLALWWLAHTLLFLLPLGLLRGLLGLAWAPARRGLPRAADAGLLLLALGLVAAHGGLHAWAGRAAPGPAVEAPALGDSAPWRVCLVGLDGADLDLVERLVAAGRLPTFERLLRGGTAAPLATNSAHSPVVWTSIATGRPATEHGILDYTAWYVAGSSLSAPMHPRDRLGQRAHDWFGWREEAAVGSNQREVVAFWELLGGAGRPSLTVGWWATWPAEPVLGALVSNRAVPWADLSLASIERVAGRDGLTHPPGLQELVVQRARQVVRDRGLPALDRDDARFFDLRDEIHEGLFHELARDGLDLRSVYLQGIDTRSHAWTHAVYGGNTAGRRPRRVSEARANALFEGMVVGAYERMDQALARIADGLGEGEGLLVVSDHGWEYDGTGHWAKPDGLLLGYGGPFAAGRRLEGAHVFDILPTLCALLGAPVSRELPGRVLEGALADGALPRVVEVERYGPRGQRRHGHLRGSDEGHLEALRSLGYID